jgi:uncharacterized protein (TIGR04255 family)
MYPQREVFPDAPLELVAVEVRYPYAPRLRKQDVVDAILEDVADDLPVLRRQQQMTFALSSGAMGQADEVPRLFDLARRTSATIAPTALTVETTAYRTFSDFRVLLMKLVESIAKHGSVAAVERIGLRYIDEIRVPEPIFDARDWRKWISDDLLSSIDLVGNHAASATQGVTEYRLPEEDTHLVFRYAATHGVGVVSNEPLKRRHPIEQPGPFFVFDLDCYFQPTLEKAPEFSPYRIGEILDGLHVPAGSAFQNVITDRLRDLFRGKQ